MVNYCSYCHQPGAKNGIIYANHNKEIKKKLLCESCENKAANREDICCLNCGEVMLKRVYKPINFISDRGTCYSVPATGCERHERGYSFPYSSIEIKDTLSISHMTCSELCRNAHIKKAKIKIQMACPICGTPAVLQKCGKCKSAKYCSRECQRKDWPNHKKICLIQLQ